MGWRVASAPRRGSAAVGVFSQRGASQAASGCRGAGSPGHRMEWPDRAGRRTGTAPVGGANKASRGCGSRYDAG